MADIAADRAWMQLHAERQAVENEAAYVKRQAAEQAEQDQTCLYCFHGTHSAWNPYGSPVSWCRDPLCVCGVPPCPGCGDRVRPNCIEDRLVERCPMCGHEMALAVYA